MRRGTTPTITATVNADLTGMAVHLAFKVGGNVIVKQGADLTIVVDNDGEEPTTAVSTSLTQEDTLSMRSGKECEVQIRAVQDDGAVAIATCIGTIPVKRILEEGVIRE